MVNIIREIPSFFFLASKIVNFYKSKYSTPVTRLGRSLRSASGVLTGYPFGPWHRVGVH